MRRFSFIAAFLLAVLVVMAGVNYPLLKKRKKGGAQTAAMKDSLPGDSVARMAVDTTKMDSLQRAIYRHNQAIDDSIHLDSLNRQKKNGIEAPIDFAAKDSMVYDARSRTAYLYGSSNVKYENMNLKSERIHVNMDSSIIHATGVRDTASKKLTGTPVFAMGKDNYESDTIAFNFKSKKGSSATPTRSRRRAICAANWRSATLWAMFICNTGATPPATSTIPTSTSRSHAPRCAPARMSSSARPISWWPMFRCPWPFLMASFPLRRNIPVASLCPPTATKAPVVSICATADIISP